ncbi:hypothetical protein ABW21_db0206491 [Orbilia brochopaga]|nr:hypothetical protein ABW21_db0206491 [Drechslerella brochopaga]
MIKAEDRDHTILANMKWIHNLQRAQMRKRHVAEIKQVQKDLEKSIDWDIISGLYPPTQEGFKQFLNPIVRAGLNSPGRFLKPTPLDVLPARDRTVLVQKDQFERLRRERQKEAGNMGVEPEPKSELSVAELEFYLEDMMAEEIAKRKEEEFALYELQEEEKHPIYKSMLKKDSSGRARLSKQKQPQAENRPQPRLAKKTTLPALRTTENIVQQMQGVTLSGSAATPTTATNEQDRQTTTNLRHKRPSTLPPKPPPVSPSTLPPKPPSVISSTKDNPYYVETSKWARARRRSENTLISPRDRSRSPGRRESEDSRSSRRYSTQNTQSWNLWATPNQPASNSPGVSDRQELDTGGADSRRESLSGLEFEKSKEASNSRRGSDNNRGDQQQLGIVGKTEVTVRDGHPDQRPGGREVPIPTSEDEGEDEVVAKVKETEIRMIRPREGIVHGVVLHLAGVNLADVHKR